MGDFIIINGKNNRILVERKKQETNQSGEYSGLLLRVWEWVRSL